MIIDLAVRGYLTIEEVRLEVLVLVGGGLPVSPRLKGSDGLKPFEKKLFTASSSRRETSVLMSDLQTKFYPVIGRVKNDLYRGLSQRGYFDGNPIRSGRRSSVLGLLRRRAPLWGWPPWFSPA